MRWHRNEYPSDGEERVFERFLLLPSSCNGEVRWLERAKYRAVWQVEFDGETTYRYWHILEWLND